MGRGRLRRRLLVSSEGLTLDLWHDDLKMRLGAMSCASLGTRTRKELSSWPNLKMPTLC
ncbi:MAG: hypothetical protein ACI9EF_001281 [Pseudohongiellaceae bacterium]|jgi:hypothetical protein